MKKWLLAIAAVLVCGAAIAQKEKLTSTSKGFLYVAAGPAIPVGDFTDDDWESNDDAGFAKTGFTVNLHGGYHATPNLGIKATAFYSRHGVENIGGIAGNVDPGHWQYYGLTAGPMYHAPLTAIMDLSLAAQFGIAYAGSPQVKFQGQELMKDDWAAAVPLRGEAALHILVGERTRIVIGSDYQYMRPEFSISTRNQNGVWSSETVKQKMGVVNVFAGIGIGF